MIWANELTGDSGIEEAGQWQACFGYTPLGGVPVAARLPHGNVSVYECVQFLFETVPAVITYAFC